MTSEPSGRRGLGSLATAAITGISLAVQAGLAAVVGVIIAREFGRNAETDGFFAAYGVFVVLGLTGNAVRLVVLPPLARARQERRLAQEAAAWWALLSAALVPLVVIGFVGADSIGDFLTGSGPAAASSTAARALPLIVLAGVGQVYAGLLASTLAALDDYLTAAVAFIVASVAGLLTILIRLDASGVNAVAIGMAVNAAVAILVQAVVLLVRARREVMPRGGMIPGGGSGGARIVQAVRGCALPLALQGSYLMCLPLAAHEGVGAVTSFGYAYLAGSAMVAATAASFGLVTAVPLTRVGLEASRVAHHVVATSWLALLAVGATAGVFAVAGEPILAHLLGAQFFGAAGADLGRLIATFAPWMVVTVGVAVTLPLVFVTGHDKTLPLVALAMLLAQAPLAFAGQRLAGLTGLAVALAASTALALAGMLHGLGAAGATFRGLAVPTVFVAAIGAPIFLIAHLLLPDMAAALVGLAAYSVAAFALHPAGLVDALGYLRALK